MNADEKQGARRKTRRRASTRERERERGCDKTATAEDAQIQVHDCVAEREELQEEEPSVVAVAASVGGDSATPAVVVPLSTGVKEATNVEGEDDDDEEEGQTRPVTTTIAGLAKEAAQLFHSRSYQGCLLILNQLLVQNETDPKVYQFKNSSCLVGLLLLMCLVVSYDKCFFSILFRLRSCNAMPVVTLSLISSLPPRGSKDSGIL
jgi:hypothetical protein